MPWSLPWRRKPAGSPVGDASAIEALETACALHTAAFRAARLSPAVPALSPGCMALIARNLIRRGEDVHQIMIEGGMVRLQPIGSWDVRGGPWESDWWYRCDRFGPSGNLTELVPSAAVLHTRYSVDSARPWYGIGPLGWARSTGTLAANLEARLGEEAGGPVGHVIPVPQDGGDGEDDDPLVQLKANLPAQRAGRCSPRRSRRLGARAARRRRKLIGSRNGSARIRPYRSRACARIPRCRCSRRAACR